MCAEGHERLHQTSAGSGRAIRCDPADVRCHVALSLIFIAFRSGGESGFYVRAICEYRIRSFLSSLSCGNMLLQYTAVSVACVSNSLLGNRRGHATADRTSCHRVGALMCYDLTVASVSFEGDRDTPAHASQGTSHRASCELGLHLATAMPCHLHLIVRVHSPCAVTQS